MANELSLEAYEVYQNGKMRRYTLLFAVNGGAFTIFQFSVQHLREADLALSLGYLCVAMIVFTIAMWYDVWKFGNMMRNHADLQCYAFTRPGKAVLSVICIVIILGWITAMLRIGQLMNGEAQAAAINSTSSCEQ